MTIKEFCEYLEDAKEHYVESDCFVQEGYGQKVNGYIDVAKCENHIIDSKIAEPNQKWHLFFSYLKRIDNQRDAKKCYNYLLCPELLLWIAEAVGLDIKEAAKEAKNIIDGGEKWARNKAGRKVKEYITWNKIMEEIELKEVAE